MMNANINNEISARDEFMNNGRLALIALLAVAFGLLALFVAAGNATALIDWSAGHTVAGSESYMNDTINADDIDIPGGTSLTLTNITLRMASWSELHVHGTLIVKDYDNNNGTTSDRSVIQRGGGSPYYIIGFITGNVLIKNSEIYNFGSGFGGASYRGIYVDNKNTTILGSKIHDGYYGVFVSSNGLANITNSSLYNNQVNAIYTEGTVNVKGCEFYGNNWAAAIRVIGSSAKAYITDIKVTSGHNGIQVRDNAFAEIKDSFLTNVYYTTLELSLNAKAYVNNTNMSYNTNNGATIINIFSSTLEMNDCDVYNSRYTGLYADASTITVTGTTIGRSTYRGIYTRNSVVTVEKSTITANGNTGILSELGSKLVVANGTIEKNSQGAIFAQGTTTVLIDDNDIKQNMNTNVIYLYSGCNKVDVIDNTIDQNNNNGVVVYSVSKFNIQGNTIERQGSFGIEIISSTTGTISGNTIKTTTSWAIKMSSGGSAVVDKNTIDNTNGGVYVYNNQAADITNNTINGTVDRFILLDSASTSRIINNKMTSPRGWTDMVYSSHSPLVIFEKNTMSGLTASGTRGWRGLYINNINVKPTITNNTFKNLTEAFYLWDEWNWKSYGLLIEGNKVIDINGNGFNIYPRLYDNCELKIIKNTFLNIQSEAMYIEVGNRNALLTIDHNDFKNVGRAIRVYDYYWWPDYWWFSPVTVSNNTVDGSNWGPSVYMTYCGDLKFYDNKIKNSYGVQIDGHGGYVDIQRTEVTESSYGMHVYFWTNDMTLWVKDSKFNNNNGEGLYSSSLNVATFDNVEFNNNYHGLYIDNNYNGGHIRNCTFINNNYYGFYQYYVYPWGNDAVLLENNVFYGNEYGYYGYYTHVEIRDNEFKNNSYGVQIGGGWSESMAKFYNNKFHDNSQAGIYNFLYGVATGSGAWNNEFLNNDVGIYHTSDNTHFVYYQNTFRMGSYGIQNWGYGNAVIHDNDFTFLSVGIYLEDASADIEGNTFTTIWSAAIEFDYVGTSNVNNNQFTGCNKAIDLYNSMVSLQGNTYSGNSYGLYVGESMAFLTQETFLDNTVAIYISVMSITTIEDVIIENSGTYGIQSEGQSYMSLVVQGDSRIIDSPIQMYGDISVEDGGSLNIDSTDFMIYSPGGTPYVMTIKDGGSLTLKDSKLVAFNKTKPFGFAALAGSSITLTDSLIQGVGYGDDPEQSGLFIAGMAAIEGVTIDGSRNALFITGGVNMVMRNSTIVNATTNDVWIEGASTLRMGNTKFNKNHVTVLDTSKIIIDRIIRIEAIDDARDPYPGVAVTVNSDGSNVGDGTTNDDGFWFEFFEGAIISKDGFTETLNNYTVTVTDGAQTFDDSFVLTDDYSKLFEFGIAPQVLNGPATMTVAEDTELEVDLTKYFADNDTIIYKVNGLVSLMVTINGDIAIVKGAPDWFGTEKMTITATDTHKLSSSYDITVIVTPVNDVPVISGVPNLILNEDEDRVMDLLPYISDPDTTISDLVVTVSTPYATINGLVVTFNYPIVTIEYVRISVKDAEGGTAQDILVSVQDTNDAPELRNLPVHFNATEDIEEVFDLAPYLFDQDSPMSEVTIWSDAKEVRKINGTKLSVLFPDGPEMRTIKITVSDGMKNRTYDVPWYVAPVNDAPSIADLPMITVTEELEYVFDLTPYLSDVDDSMSELIVTVNRSDIRVEGKLLFINIQESGAMITAQVTVSDGKLSTSKSLKISVTPVNDQPSLENGKVSKTSGTTEDTFTFTVTITDPDAEFPTVYVVIDGQRYTMKKVSGDFETGAQYSLKMKLKSGSHSFRFEANDGSGAPNANAWTSDQTNLKVAEPMNWMPIIFIIGIILAIAIILIVARSRSKPAEDLAPPVEEPEEEEEPVEKGGAFKAMDEEEEAEEEPEAEEPEAEEAEVEEEEPVKEEPKTLKAKETAADVKAVPSETTPVKLRRARDPNLPKSEDLDKVEPEKPKDAASLKEKDSESEVKGTDGDLDSLMKDIMKDSKKKKLK